MFRHIRRWLERYKKYVLDSYDLPKPTVYVLGKKKFVKKKVLHRPKDKQS